MYLKQTLMASFVGIGLALPAMTQAAPFFSYEADFEGPNGSQPAGWEYNGSGRIEILNSQLHMERTSSAPNNGAHSRVAVYNGESAEGVAAAEWDNYTVTMRFQQSHNNHVAVAARYQVETIPNHWNYGYAAYIDGSTFGIVQDFYNYTSHPQANGSLYGDILGTAALEVGIAYNTALRIEFTVNGSELTATLYNEDADDAVLGTVNVWDDTYATGAAGLRSHFNGNNRWVDVASFSVAAVPEPASLGLFAAGGLLMLRRRRDEASAA